MREGDIRNACHGSTVFTFSVFLIIPINSLTFTLTPLPKLSSHAHFEPTFLSGKMLLACEITMLYVCPPNFEKFNIFRNVWYAPCATAGHPNFYLRFTR
jgi:hypothetical protein